MKGSRFPGMARRISSTPHYQTFAVKPPSGKGRPPASREPSGNRDRARDRDDGSPPDRYACATGGMDQSPLPVKQLTVLAVIALAEQTALNSISPYLPEMAASFPGVALPKVGLYVGIIASAFALAQFATGYFWGWLSDRIGRKPVVLMGTLLTAACLLAFGFCKTLWQAVLAQALMGLVNGNTGVVSTCLGEITDRTNQSRAFVWLPVIYGIGGITGPLLGGLLVAHHEPDQQLDPNVYPFLLPNVISAAILIIDLIVTMLYLDESLEEAQKLPPLGTRLYHLTRNSWRNVWRKVRPGRVGDHKTDEDVQAPSSSSSEERLDIGTQHGEDTALLGALLTNNTEELSRKDIFNRDTVLIMITYLIFQLDNISFNSLYPIFASSPEPAGRNLSPKVIGLSLAFAGVVAIVFQVGIFSHIRDKFGNKITYRASLAGFIIAFFIMPFVGYKDKGKGALWTELGIALLIKTVVTVGGLTSALLLITNSAPNHSVLGTLNGLAQTLSAGGRAIGPFVSGGLFSLSTQIKPKGEALAWGVFGGIALVGFLLSFGIRGHGLEDESWEAEQLDLSCLALDSHFYATTADRRSFQSSVIGRMFTLPAVRRWFLPMLLFLSLITIFKTHQIQIETVFPTQLFGEPGDVDKSVHIPASDFRHRLLPVHNGSTNHLPPPKEFYYGYKGSNIKSWDQSHNTSWHRPASHPHLDVLFKCPRKPNRFTRHIRLPDAVYNVSNTATNSTRIEDRIFWNPTIISLPYWSKNQYLLVSRIVTDGNHQQNTICEANICYPPWGQPRANGELICTGEDLEHVGPAGGFRCAHEPITLGVPPTPAEKCEGKFEAYTDIPGFHDPRIFWSGRENPDQEADSHTRSRYACFGLWLIDLRTLYPPLQTLSTGSPNRPSLGPLMSYPSLTELTRNPASDRWPIEKNWMLFFPSTGGSYVHYEMSPIGGRTFAKLLGSGLSTPNLTDPLEQPCLIGLPPDTPDLRQRNGTWHQATNSLRLVLCMRSDAKCSPKPANTVFFAVVHRKHPNYLRLPLRYERYFMVWSGSPPFSMLGVSRWPIILANETASGYSEIENWDDDEQAKQEGRPYWAYFTYTVSIAYAWGREGDELESKNWGYLDDDVVLGIGVDDLGQAYSRVKVLDLLQCLRACPGRGNGTQWVDEVEDASSEATEEWRESGDEEA
ncbi:MAG: hypothetical protein M1814_003726 [Vezdaea aestivalis]|nr:MAG: hypothetical protein M1814_003726 [Vezdaea aestivalis]